MTSMVNDSNHVESSVMNSNRTCPSISFQMLDFFEMHIVKQHYCELQVENKNYLIDEPFRCVENLII